MFSFYFFVLLNASGVSKSNDVLYVTMLWFYLCIGHAVHDYSMMQLVRIAKMGPREAILHKQDFT